MYIFFIIIKILSNNFRTSLSRGPFTLSMKVAKRLLRLLICSFSWARLMDRFGSISRLRGASRLLLTDRDASGAPRPWWCPLVPAYRELLLREMPLKPPWTGPKPLSLLEPLLLRTELLELIRLVRLRLMMKRDGGLDEKQLINVWIGWRWQREMMKFELGWAENGRQKQKEKWNRWVQNVWTQ